MEQQLAHTINPYTKDKRLIFYLDTVPDRGESNFVMLIYEADDWNEKKCAQIKNGVLKGMFACK